MPLSTSPTIFFNAISSRGATLRIFRAERRTNGKTQSHQHDRAVLLLSLFRSRHVNLTTPERPFGSPCGRAGAVIQPLDDLVSLWTPQRPGDRPGDALGRGL
jgi:hypothetical protein